jgi:hypothetical protein
MHHVQEHWNGGNSTFQATVWIFSSEQILFTLKNAVLWDVTPCGLTQNPTDMLQAFRELNCHSSYNITIYNKSELPGKVIGTCSISNFNS